MKTTQSILFASGTAFAVMAASMPLAAGDIAHLRAQIRAMQGRIESLGTTEVKPVYRQQPRDREYASARPSAGERTFPWRSSAGSLGPITGPFGWSSDLGVWDNSAVVLLDGPGAGHLDAPRPVWTGYRLTDRIQFILAVGEPRHSAAAASADAAERSSLLQASRAVTRYLATTLHYRWDSVSAFLTGYVHGSGVGSRAPLTTFDFGSEERRLGWGLSLSADHRITGRITLGGGVAYVEGLPGYTFGNTLAAIIGPIGTATAFDPGNTVGAFGWVRYHWTSTIRSNAIIGYARQDIAGDLPGTGPFSDTGAWTIHANIIWSPARRLNLGAEYSRLVRSVHDIPGSGANRFQVGMQYRF